MVRGSVTQVGLCGARSATGALTGSLAQVVPANAGSSFSQEQNSFLQASEYFESTHYGVFVDVAGSFWSAYELFPSKLVQGVAVSLSIR